MTSFEEWSKRHSQGADKDSLDADAETEKASHSSQKSGFEEDDTVRDASESWDDEENL